VIAALLALLVWFAAHLTPATVVDVATVAHAGPAASAAGRPQPSTPSPAAPSVDVDEPTCLAGEEWDGLRCVALQLPEETTGRQYDPAD